METRFPTLRVGELARQSGVSIRTLHHYDAIGLLKPQVGGAGEHRLYGPAQVARLQQILSLRELGFSLGEIQSCLDDPDLKPASIVQAHLERVEEDLRKRTDLRDLLRSILTTLNGAQEPSVQELLKTIEGMTGMDIFSKYYTPEQLKTLAERKQLVGPERMQAVAGEWQELFADFRDAMQRGLPPDSEEALALAARARALVEEFSGGDKGIERSLANLYAGEPSVRQRTGAEPALWQFMGAARKALEKGKSS